MEEPWVEGIGTIRVCQTPEIRGKFNSLAYRNTQYMKGGNSVCSVDRSGCKGPRMISKCSPGSGCKRPIYVCMLQTAQYPAKMTVRVQGKRSALPVQHVCVCVYLGCEIRAMPVSRFQPMTVAKPGFHGSGYWWGGKRWWAQSDVWEAVPRFRSS